MKANFFAVAAITIASIVPVMTVDAADRNTRASSSLAVAPQASRRAPSCDDCYAVVNANATLDRGRHVRSVRDLGTGTYEVRFRYEFLYCSWQGTVGNPDFVGTQPASSISVTGRAGTNDGLFVQTFNSAGTLTDRSFHVVIVC